MGRQGDDATVIGEHTAPFFSWLFFYDGTLSRCCCTSSFRPMRIDHDRVELLKYYPIDS